MGPDSVEEAAALLGASIPRCSMPAAASVVLPPAGMHSSFGVQAVPMSELVMRLSQLRSFLRSTTPPLTAAKSILEVLKKLISVSSTLGSSAPNETAPLFSTPVRRLWVECIVLCHELGMTTGPLKIDPIPFLRQLFAVASLHPRSARAAGGVRIAALEGVAGLLQAMPRQTAPWALEVLQVTLKALRSAGTGEPTFRVAALQAAHAAAIASRKSAQETRNSDALNIVFAGSLEEKAIIEAVKVLKQAVTDKLPEVRSEAASMACVLVPVAVSVVPSSHADSDSNGGPLAHLDEVIGIALRNLDDESPKVADGWAEALARAFSTAVQFNQQQESSSRSEEGVGRPYRAESASSRFGFRKTAGLGLCLTNLNVAVSFLVDHYVKVGGEVVAPRMGGTFSIGGRSVRIGLSLALTKLLRLQSTLDAIGDSRSLSVNQVLKLVLQMAGGETEKQLKSPSNTGAGGPTSPLFGATRTWSKADEGLVCLTASRVIRQGISEVSAEPVQLGILQQLINLLSPNSENPQTCNSHQLQIVFVEISHLFATLGEASGSAVSDSLTRLQICLGHVDAGVRHEAAIALASLTSAFPAEGRKLIKDSLEEIQQHHAQIVTMSSVNQPKVEDASGKMRMFRRSKEKFEEPNPSRIHESTIHGRALAASILIKQIPSLPGGLPCNLLERALSVSEILISCQFNATLTKGNPSGACICVRAGFAIISGVLATGPQAVTPHISLIFAAWQKCLSCAKTDDGFLAPRHDLLCLDGAVSSVVVFLKYCSELLLVVPDALSQVSVLLETILPLLGPQGRLGSIESTLGVVSILESAKASLLEGFAWLPSGSFPMVADDVFSFAALHIRSAVENDVPCSIVHALVNKEDSILDAKSASRAKREGQIGGLRDLEETILLIVGENALHGEREAVMHLLSDESTTKIHETTEFRGSRILGHFACDFDAGKAPTPLHEVGTWRRPFDPSSSSKIRLVDAAIQAFSATFGLKSGKEQQSAMDMLESMVPPLLTQLAKTIGVNAALTEQDRRTKAKEDNAAVANIIAVLLSCLQALPLHEATHNVPIGLGPPWMNKAKDLLLTLLPSASSVVRRAAAEGLALLATLGVTEDAHFLQSTVLHSLDEVMQGNKPDGKPKPISLEPVSAARAGSLLTLACIQRTAQNVKRRQLERARARVKNYSEGKKRDDNLPVLQMMSRILPSVECHGIRDYFGVRVHALHSFGVLLSYSGRLESSTPRDEDLQLLRKAISLLDDNFCNAWTAASTDFDRGQEAEKLSSEVAFLAVLIRLMTCLLPKLFHLNDEANECAQRFSAMTSFILETHGNSAVLAIEAMAFFEAFSSHPAYLPKVSSKLKYTENAGFNGVPFMISSLSPPTLELLSKPSNECKGMASFGSARAVVWALTLLNRVAPISRWSDMELLGRLFAALERVCGSRQCLASTMLRSLAADRGAKLMYNEAVPLESELSEIVPGLFLLDMRHEARNHLRWILLAKTILSGSTISDLENPGHDNPDSETAVVIASRSRALRDVYALHQVSTQPRWQVRVVAAIIASLAIDEISRLLEAYPNDTKISANICPQHARNESDLAREEGSPAESYLVFHIEECITAACVGAAATLDQVELYILQAASLKFLEKLIALFTRVKDPLDPNSSILEQFSPQIFSTVRQAVSASEESQTAASINLVVAGCTALTTIVLSGLASEVSTIKRICRPAIPTTADTPFFTYLDPYPTKQNRLDEEMDHWNFRSAPLQSVCKVLTAGTLNSFLAGLGSNADLSTGLHSVIENKAGLAAHSAAFSVCGAQLLLGNGVSLVGRPLNDTSGDMLELCECGFLYDDIDDIDNTVKAFLVENWASYATNALYCVIQTLHSQEVDNNIREGLYSWVDMLVPMLICGSFDAVSGLEQDGAAKASLPWMKGLSSDGILVSCLQGLSQFVAQTQDSMVSDAQCDHVMTLIELLYSHFVVPALNKLAHEENLPSTKVLTHVLQLILSASSSGDQGVRAHPKLLVAVLSPLDKLDFVSMESRGPLNQFILTSSLSALSNLVLLRNEAIIQAALDLAINILADKDRFLSGPIAESGKKLLETCLKHEVVDAERQEDIAAFFAEIGNWEGWILVVSIGDGCSVSRSIPVIHSMLSNLDFLQGLIGALHAVRDYIQKQQLNSPNVGSILHGVLADVLNALYVHGTFQVSDENQSQSKLVCADAMKVVLLAYQCLCAEDPVDEVLAEFILVWFEVLLAVLRVNGLPNHPSPSTLGDPALGLLSAQAVLHVARTTPVAFKASLSKLSEVDRSILEFSVRAEMNGYPSPADQVPKRKLNLSNFKK